MKNIFIYFDKVHYENMIPTFIKLFSKYNPHFVFGREGKDFIIDHEVLLNKHLKTQGLNCLYLRINDNSNIMFLRSLYLNEFLPFCEKHDLIEIVLIKNPDTLQQKKYKYSDELLKIEKLIIDGPQKYK